MIITFQVHHSKDFGDVANDKTFVLSSLFEIDPYRLDIEDRQRMTYWLIEFVNHLKSKISYNEITALCLFKPVLQITTEYTCLKTKETKHYKMESLLHHVYPLNNKQLEELSTDLFLIFAEKWLEMHKKCGNNSNGD